MKSKRKDVLVKNVGGGPTLFQSPGDSTPKFMDLVNAARGRGTKGGKLGFGGQAAGMLGLAGKGLAGLQTVNQVAQQAQAGNPLGAALGAGYAFEANDPTGKRTATAIQGQAPPTPSVEEQRANVPQIPTPGSVQDTRLPSDDFGGMAESTYPSTASQLPPPAPPVAVNSAIPQHGTAKISSDISDLEFGTHGKAVSMNQQPMNQQLMQPQPVQQPMQQPAPIQQPMQPQPVPPTDPNQTQLPLPQVQNQNVAEDPFTHKLLQQQAQEQLMGTDNNDNKLASAEFFASTLMEKLGADTVYKMNPHQVAMVSAYTFLKLS
tara:strand:+ start:15053 stop:16009 length:957 start_codon:yes stop_codon:yes gene_type:complete